MHTCPLSKCWKATSSVQFSKEDTHANARSVSHCNTQLVNSSQTSYTTATSKKTVMPKFCWERWLCKNFHLDTLPAMFTSGFQSLFPWDRCHFGHLPTQVGTHHAGDSSVLKFEFSRYPARRLEGFQTFEGFAFSCQNFLAMISWSWISALQIENCIFLQKLCQWMFVVDLRSSITRVVVPLSFS